MSHDEQLLALNKTPCVRHARNLSVNLCQLLPNLSAYDLTKYLDAEERRYYHPTSFQGEDDPVLLVLKDVQKFFIPLSCLLGCAGNVTSVGIFLTRSMRRKSYIHYLTIKCLMDTLFLLALFVLWLDRVDVTWFHQAFVCQLVVFVTYLSSHMSVWMVVMVTIENYVYAGHPERVKTLCNPGRAKLIAMVIFLVGVSCYNFPFWTTYIWLSGDKYICTTKDEYTNFYRIFTYVDTVLTLVLPSILLFVFTTGILHCLLVTKKGFDCIKLRQQRRRKTFYMSPYTHITVMLLAVTASFILLHTPSHGVRLRLVIQTLVTRDPNQLLPTLRLQRLFEMLYYSNFSTNFVTYYFSGKHFRRILKNRLSCCLCSKTLDGRQMRYV